MIWNNRELVSSTLLDGTVISFEYNSDGIRTQKEYHNISGNISCVYNYTYDGNRIIKEQVDTVNDINNTSYTLYYMYDECGDVVGFIYNEAYYYYQKNLQGDIIRIVNVEGNVVVEYNYDAWGNLLTTTGSLASTIGRYNPFRYRSYYYDVETGWYYLQSRYYDPTIGRFINADSLIGANGDIIGYNMFAYCNNNPVMGSDPSGHGWFEDLGEWIGDKVDDASDWIEEKVDDVCEWVDEEIIEPVVEFVEEEIIEPVGEFIDDVAEDASNFDLDNTSEATVIKSNYFSAYEGHFVLRLPIGNNAFSFGALFIGNDVNDPNTIKHENGHAIHYDQIGPRNYFFFVAIPSLYGYWTDVPYDEYYSQPWERIADELGGVDRPSYPYVDNNWGRYYILTRLFFWW